MPPFRVTLALLYLFGLAIFAYIEIHRPAGDGGRRPQVVVPIEPPPTPAPEHKPSAPDTAESEKKPQKAERDAKDALPKPDLFDPTVSLEMEPCPKACTGTAFSLDRRGLWMTARHVVEGCQLVGIITGPKERLRVIRIEAQNNSDLALLWTMRGEPELAITEDGLRRNQNGYSFGFPQGGPGALHGRLIGHARIKVRGAARFTAPALVWAEIRRQPFGLAKLGGISGGPMLDEKGAVVGAMTASAPRRGRVISTDTESLVAALRRAGEKPDTRQASPRGPEALGPESFAKYGDTLRHRKTVGQVFCIGGTRSSRRPKPTS